MFDNPEKLFIILLIALFIFGPQKLIGLGTSMGKAIRDFRGAVRDAHDQFSTAVAEAQKTEEAFTTPEPLALPAPEPIAPVLPAASDPTPPAHAATTQVGDAGAAAAAPTPGSAPGSPAEPAVEHEGPHSLASEPSAQAVLESLQRKG